MYPDKAREIDNGFAEAGPAVWQAFTRVTGLYKFFSFTPDEIKNNPDKDQPRVDQSKPWSH
jgi:hypothetical protein